MAFNYTDQNKKIVLHSWGRFKAVLTEAVAVGDLLALDGTSASVAVRLAADGTGDADAYGAVAVACQDGIAADEITCALAAELRAPSSIGAGGAVTRTYFGAVGDYIGSALYLGELGKPSDTIGDITAQGVGYYVARDTILLVPGGSITGAAGNFTTLAASGATSLSTTLAVAGVATFAVQDIHTLGLAVATLKPTIQGLVNLPKMLATAKTSGSGAWTMAPAELLGGFIVDATATGASAPTLPTVAAVVNLIPGYIVGTTIRLIFKNTGNQTATLTTDASTQWTMEGIATIITKETREFLLRIEGATAGTCYALGHSTSNT